MPHTHSIIVLTKRRHPADVLLLAVSLLQGLAFVLGTPVRPPTSIEQIMPDWLILAWYWTLIVSGAVGLTGNFWPGHILTSLRIRLSGVMFAAAPAAAYTVVSAVYGGLGAMYTAGVVAAWVAMCLWRAAQLTSDIRHLRRAAP